MPIISSNSSSFLLVSCVFLLGFCGWLIYKTVDQSVTLDHQIQQEILLAKQRDLLLDFSNGIADTLPEGKIRKLLKGKANSFEKEAGQLVVDQVSFFFENGRLFKVSVQ